MAAGGLRTASQTMTEPTKLHARRVLAVLALLTLALAGQARSDSRVAAAPSKASARPKSAAARRAAVATPATTIANVGSGRTVTDLDIRQAALALVTDPLQKRDPAAWRRMLLDRCVDRELLAMEADRRGLDKEPALASRVAEREYLTLHREIFNRVVIPGLIPTPEQLREVRAEGLHRLIDINFILIRDHEAGSNRRLAEHVYEKAKAGARFDSLAKIYSEHPPTRAAGGHFGWVLARDLDPLAYNDLRHAQVGDVMGVFSGPDGHEIYKIGGFRELSDDSLFALVSFERKRNITSDYEKSVLAKYHFAIDSTQVERLIFATGSETADSILASLGPDGTRSAQGVRPAIGILARCDGESVTFPQLVRAMPSAPEKGGRIIIRNAQDYFDLCAHAVLHGLTIRDAKDRGIDKDPVVARELRLSRDGILTDAMVTRSTSPPNDVALRAMIEMQPDHYRRPRATVARVAMFAKPESAAQAVTAWTGTGMNESLLEARQLRGRGPGSASSLLPGWFATVTLFEGDTDALTRAIAGVPVGQLTPPVATERGWAVAQVLSTEEARPLTFEEAAPRALREWREDAENKWVLQMLERLRAKTPVRTVPGRLAAVKLASAGTTSTTTTRQAAR